MCCCFSCSNKSALVVTRILMAILISHLLASRWKSASGGSRNAVLILACSQNRLRTHCLWLVFFRWNEPVPTDRKSATGLSPVVELKNEFTRDIERNWERDHWSTRAIGRSRRIVLNHTDPPLLLLLCA